jgi:hypothetical protein
MDPVFSCVQILHLTEGRVNYRFFGALQSYTFPDRVHYSLPGVREYLATQSGVGYFTSAEEVVDLNAPLVRIVDLERGVELSTLNLKTVLSPEQQAIDFFRFQSCVAAHPRENHRLLTVSDSGILSEWDLTDISHPKHIQSIPTLQESDHRWVKNSWIFNNSILVFLECRRNESSMNMNAAKLRCYCLNSRTLDSQAILSTLSTLMERF